jgi:hypothetical protein
MTKEEKEKQDFDLEMRKIKALEKIANSLDALTIWFEEIDKDDWSARIQYYLSEFHGKFIGEVIDEEKVEEPLDIVKKTNKK